MDRFSEGSHWLGKFLERPEVEAQPLVRAKSLAVQSLLLVTNDLPAGYANAALSLELFKNASDRSGEALSLLALGVTQALHGDFVLARPLLDKSLNLYEALGDKLGQSNVLSWLTLDRHCDVAQSTSFIERSLALSREIGHTLGILGGLVGLAQQYYWTGNFKRTEALLEEAAIVQQQLNSRSTQAWVLDMRGNMAHRNGNLDEAEMYYQQSILLNEESGHQVHGMWAKSNLAAIAIQRGDFARARELLTLCVLKFKETEIENGVVYCLENFANLAIQQGDLTRAAVQLAWADAYRHHIGDVRPAVEQKFVDKSWLYLHSNLDAEALEAASAQGRRMTYNEAVDYSLQANL
jgi:tetratricopeptide (TPR) repeat protein